MSGTQITAVMASASTNMAGREAMASYQRRRDPTNWLARFTNTIVAGQSGTGVGRMDPINQNIAGVGVIAQSFTASSHLSLTGISFVACG